MNGWRLILLVLTVWVVLVTLMAVWVSVATRKAAPKLYDPQTSEPSFWAAPADATKNRKRQAR